jgi:hypothetical protein
MSKARISYADGVPESGHANLTPGSKVAVAERMKEEK